MRNKHECLVVEYRFEPWLYHLGRPHTIDYEDNVVAHENGGDEELRFGVEQVQGAPHEAPFLHVEFDAYAVGGDEGYLYAGKQSREGKRY